MAVPPLNHHILQKYFTYVVKTCTGTLLSHEQISRLQMCFLMHPNVYVLSQVDTEPFRDFISAQKFLQKLLNKNEWYGGIT